MPNWARVFVFGSALHTKRPKDLDLLIVYDSTLCPASHARQNAEHLAATIGQTVGLSPHVVVLSEKEDKNISFIRSEGCVLFEEWLDNRRK